MSDLQHGKCNALLLESVINFNFEACPERYETIARTMNVDCSSHEPAEIKKKLLSPVQVLKTELRITDQLRDPGVLREDISSLAKSAILDPCLATNPRRPELRDLEHMYEEAF